MSLSVITGANRGIGLALTRALRKRGGTVVAICRQSSEPLARTGAEVVEGADVSERAAIDKIRSAVGDRKVDLLINNAGIARWPDKLGALDVDGIRQQFEVNALAPLLLTEALRPALARGAKI